MEDKKALVEYLLGFVTERKNELFSKKIAQRTKHLTVVVENLYQDHNFSAVMRSCDCFGLQDMHVVENSNAFRVNADIALGASQWVNVHRYRNNENNTVECIKQLKAQGYTIVATTPHRNDVNLEEYDISQPTALIFGTEKEGLTQEALDMADVYLKVPMVGFTESLNISVCAAICIHHLTWKMREQNINWPLSEADKWDVLYKWVRAALKDPDGIESVWREKMEKGML
jgi:tRNA (guanosine-2'-O-)-methyltransferase